MRDSCLHVILSETKLAGHIVEVHFDLCYFLMKPFVALTQSRLLVCYCRLSVKNQATTKPPNTECTMI